MVLVMRDLHLLFIFCSKKMCLLLYFHTQVISSSQQAHTYRWQAGLFGLFQKGEAATCHMLSESLQKLLELGDDLCVHRFHERLEALFSQ